MNTEKKPAGTPAAAPSELSALATAGDAIDQANLPEGERTTAAAPPAEPAMPTKDIVKMAATPLFAVLAPNWKVSAAEIDQLSECYGALLDKYFPDFQTSMGPEIACVMLTSAVILPRVVMKIPRVAEEKPVKANTNGDGASGD